MRWHDVLRVAGDACEASAVLGSIYQGAVRLAAPGVDHRVPVLELILIDDGEEEVFAPCVVQFDQFTETLDALLASERELRRLFHVELFNDFGDVTMFGQFIGSAELASPDRDGHYGRGVRFRFTPEREHYAAPDAS